MSVMPDATNAVRTRTATLGGVPRRAMLPAGVAGGVSGIGGEPVLEER